MGLSVAISHWDNVKNNFFSQKQEMKLFKLAYSRMQIEQNSTKTSIFIQIKCEHELVSTVYEYHDYFVFLFHLEFI